MNLCLAATAFAACGSNSPHRSIAQSGTTRTESASSSNSETTASDGEGVVARIDGHTISQALLAQWMREKIGEIFYEVTTRRAPPRLISEPANTPACVAALKAFTSKHGNATHQAQPTSSELTTKCKQVHQRFKELALSFLISSFWSQGVASSQGIKVSEAEVQRKLMQIRAEQYPTKQAFEQLLDNHTRTLSQELFLIRIDLIQQRLEAKLRSDGPNAYKEAAHATANAQCRPGYIVEFCRGYRHPTSETTPVGAILLEEIARWRRPS
jgi:hypothetical protein